MCSFDRSLQQVAALGCLQVYTCSCVSTMHTALSADPQVQFGTLKKKNFLGGFFSNSLLCYSTCGGCVWTCTRTIDLCIVPSLCSVDVKTSSETLSQIIFENIFEKVFGFECTQCSLSSDPFDMWLLLVAYKYTPAVC
jgi:hypothetical protein